VSEGVNRKPGSKSSFFGCRHISTSGFVRSATASFSWVSCTLKPHWGYGLSVWTFII